MSLLADFFPVIVFFTVFKLKGIMYATVATIIASVLQLIFLKIRFNQIKYTQWFSAISVFILGGAALICKKEIFIKWKPTVIYWVIALVLLACKYIKNISLVKKVINKNITLPDNIWHRLDIAWISFFAFMGLLNLYVVYHFDTNTWVNFKLFGTIGLMMVFVAGQVIFLSKYLKN